MRGNIDEIITRTKERVSKKREELPPARIEKKVEHLITNNIATGSFKTFGEALEQNGLTVIAEVSNTNDDNDPLELAYECEAGDADAIAYSTEPYWYDGDDDIFIEMRDEISVPMLRRDYIVDPYQLFETKLYGADAIVLNSEIAGDDFEEFLKLCGLLRMDVLVETTNAYDLPRILDLGAKAVSVRPNGPNEALSKEDEMQVIEALPDDVFYVAQSRIMSVEDALAFKEAGASAVLVSDLLMSASSDDERTAIIRAMKE